MRANGFECTRLRSTRSVLQDGSRDVDGFQRSCASARQVAQFAFKHDGAWKVKVVFQAHMLTKVGIEGSQAGVES
jgi:hypothetical protein